MFHSFLDTLTSVLTVHASYGRALFYQGLTPQLTLITIQILLPRHKLLQPREAPPRRMVIACHFFISYTLNLGL